MWKEVGGKEIEAEMMDGDGRGGGGGKEEG